MGEKEPLLEFLARSLRDETSLSYSLRTVTALLIYGLVKDPGAVSVRCQDGAGVTALEFDVGEVNRGRVIGKHGHTIKALRSLCRSIAKGRGEEIILDLVGWTENRDARGA